MRKVLLLGATSAIAKETARHFARHGDSLYLVARNDEKLAIISQDLKIRGAQHVTSEALDLDNTRHHAEMLKRAIRTMDGVDVVLITYGTLADQQICEKDYMAALKELHTNCLSVLSILTEVANYFEQQQSGTIAVISSVAGDRGRQSNYVYGTAKGALTIFLQGLRNRLAKHNINIVTIKPGFVDTPMTKDFKKGVLWVGPEVIGRGIYNAICKRKDVVYLPFFWRYIMLIIKLIPERFFKKLSL